MNTGNQPFNETRQPDSDADVNLLLYKTGKAFKEFVLWIGRGIKKTGNALLVTLLFLFRNIIWLLIGAGLGLAYGLYKESRNSTFTSQMVLKANYNSARSVYNTVEYLNALISANQTSELGKFFGISPAEAQQLTEFSVEPIESELSVAELYKQEFFQPERDKKIRLDTFWTRTVKYADFKESLSKYDYPYQVVTAHTTNRMLFSRLGNGISQHVNSNTLLTAVNEQQAKSNADEERILLASISNIDSLRRAYNERLIKGEAIAQPGNQITVLQGLPQETSAPELELYDKLLRLQDELKKSRTRAATEKNVVEIFSPFNPVGKKESFVKSVGWSALIGLLTVMAILLLLALYKWLVKFEASHPVRKKPAV
jgi:hypothetical protein